MSLATAVATECPPAPTDPARASAREVPPDITSARHWPGACVGATLWALFILYTVGRGLAE